MIQSALGGNSSLTKPRVVAAGEPRRIRGDHAAFQGQTARLLLQVNVATTQCLVPVSVAFDAF